MTLSDDGFRYPSRARVASGARLLLALTAPHCGHGPHTRRRR